VLSVRSLRTAAYQTRTDDVSEPTEPIADPIIVIPAKAGIHFSTNSQVDEWIPAFAGKLQKGAKSLESEDFC
jgi:hypothetical protein